TGLILPPLHVPNTYPTISQALSATAPGQPVVVWRGTYDFSGTLSIQSGKTLFIQGGANLRFGSGTQMSSNGRLFALGNIAERVTVTRLSTASWNGILFTSAGSSWLGRCDIKYANLPVTANSTNNLTISNCTIANSSFGGDAALRFYGSSPTITSTTING
ncbi:MAG: hypothetical protein ACRDGA_13865, partial [Bacteroidota bacterium]